MSSALSQSDDIATLKRLAAGIIRAQGNRFVKELLRRKNIRIGSNKDDFERGLTAAIESGELTLEDVEQWLAEVEGWGNQHVYLFNISSTLKRELTQPKLRQRVRDAGLDHLWDAQTVMVFPEVAQLTSISFVDGVLRLVWQETSPGWVAVPEKNFTREEDLDLYEYRAFRKVEWRAITRFEAHVSSGIAALFIADPIVGEEHAAAIVEAKRVIDLLMPLAHLERGQFNIPMVAKNLDQQNVPTNKVPNPGVKAQKSRLGSGDASIEFAANAPGKAYWEEQAIQDVRNAVRAQQLNAFHGVGGVFHFQDGDGLTRPLRVQLYGKDHRIRLRAEMNASEVWTILAKLSRYQ
ncbi:MAG TPA: hypothetical protein VGQ76_23980 [Thermoanaerobaculia bacterium]|jgi:hypothetical protein|nr:hypothetical protein [Thermoanaerobaculia bacterium]